VTTCAFDLAHYRELLEAARDGGYRFVFFDRAPEPHDLFLRHDVDLSLEAALELAELEHELGVHATYFLMVESVFYNLASPIGARTVDRLRNLGHAVGLHAVHPHAHIDERFDRVIAWHNPDPQYMTEPIVGATNVMTSPFFNPASYRSDSNQHWRNGCPHEELRKGAFEWLQLLVHPEIWVYEGDTMRQSMFSMLEAKRELGLEQLGEDRIDLS
jgi:hypothetical protein